MGSWTIFCMNKPLIHHHTKRDFLVCLAIWLALEVLCFLLLPLLGIISFEDNINQWLLPSIPVGITGASIFALSTQLFMLPLPSVRSSSKKAQVRLLRWGRILLGGLAAWIGLAGVAFPVLVISARFFTQLLQNA
jgi:hypothetical protein